MFNIATIVECRERKFLSEWSCMSSGSPHIRKKYWGDLMSKLQRGHSIPLRTIAFVYGAVSLALAKVCASYHDFRKEEM